MLFSQVKPLYMLPFYFFILYNDINSRSHYTYLTMPTDSIILLIIKKCNIGVYHIIYARNTNINILTSFSSSALFAFFDHRLLMLLYSEHSMHVDVEQELPILF